jgi:hypothetical protein
LPLVLALCWSSTALAGGPCVPDGAVLDLSLAGGTPTVCATAGDDPTKTSCFSVDVRSGALAPSASTFTAGISHQATPDAKRCVEGLCMHGRSGGELLVVRSTDGVHAAVVDTWGDAPVEVFELASKKRVKSFPIKIKHRGDADWVNRVAYVASTLYVEEENPGGFSQIHVYGDDGKSHGLVKDRKGKPIYGALALRVLDDHRAAIVASSFRELVMLEGAKATFLDRPVATAPCTDPELESQQPGNDACQKHYDRNFGPFASAPIVALSTGEYAAVVGGHELAVLDGKLAEQRRVPLAMCK